MKGVGHSPNPVVRQGIILALILLATWLRFWQLASVPPGLWFDEAYNGMDAVWMTKVNTWPVFLAGNNGREAMFHYLLALSIAVFGETALAIRLVPALLGILSIPVMYRWSLTVFKGQAQAWWLALAGTAGLATSFLYLLMNRTGYRANLLPLFIMGVSLFFWRGWQTGKIYNYLVAGIGLGLSQYTYTSARLLPLLFLLFLAGQSLLFWRQKRGQLKSAWTGLLLMAGAGACVATPLLVFSFNNPEAFWTRVEDVAFKVSWSAEGIRLLSKHLWESIGVFLNGEDPNWRHHLPGRPGFDWFSTVGFWGGLMIAVRQYRRPANLFLLALLLVMWLPAPLSAPAFHTLRLSGVLPAYYALVALGVVNLAIWLQARGQRVLQFKFMPAALAVFFLLSGGLNFYDYFYRWARRPEVYSAFDGPVVDLATYLAGPESGTDLIIPFYLYTHASIRYFLHDNFREEVWLPQTVAAELLQQDTVSMIVPEYPADDGLPPAFVWLRKNEGKIGTAYVSVVRRDVSLNQLSLKPAGLVKGSHDNVIARQYRARPQDVLALFPQQKPKKTVAVEWAANLLLNGYEFMPAMIQAGESGTLYLSWKIVGYTGLPEKMFLQLLDSQGRPVSQAELEPISRKMYRWRDDGLILEQHPFEIPPSVPAGLYFARLGFFDPETGQRLPAYTASQQLLNDELIVGPLYVKTNGHNPLKPQHPVKAMLGQAFELLGYSLYPLAAQNSTEVELYWKTQTPVDLDYTVFVQLLDQENQVITQVDRQPLLNLYPTSRWQAGDIISDRFVLPLALDKLLDSGRLITGMYNLSTGVRLPAYNHQGELLPDDLVELKPQ